MLHDYLKFSPILILVNDAGKELDLSWLIFDGESIILLIFDVFIELTKITQLKAHAVLPVELQL